MAPDSQPLDADPAFYPVSDTSPAFLRRGASIVLAICAGLALLIAGVFAARHDDVASLLLILMATVMIAALLTANHALDRARRRLGDEQQVRTRVQDALRQSQGREAEARLLLSTERGQLALRRAHVAFALSAGELGSWTRDLRTGQVRASELFRIHHGLPADAPAASAAEFLGQVHPEDRDALVWRMEAATADQGVLEAEYRIITPGGGTRWLLIRCRAYCDDAGAPVRVAGVSMDVTARKTADEGQRLLLDELNHRVKNTLSAVQSIALQTGRSVDTPQAFESAFVARINALARVHDLLTEAAWQGASLGEVVARTLAPYEGGGRVIRTPTSPPDVSLGPNAAVTLAMAFHELATNASKYGALSASGGQVGVDWRLLDVGGRTLLEIAWVELGGPTVRPPSRRGFGTQFVQRALAREFDGSVSLQFAPAGLSCCMRLPLSAKLRRAA
ncbi:MAG TPA: HWE histidine kinase domain-containing protein [Caulobacteraceae bacterium]|nr:HWE histidine kinase domain-containing protein [Caulobacteraceae bacterium]